MHAGIGENKKINFKYFNYSITKEKVFRRCGQLYTVSPFALTLSEDTYYLVGFDSDAGMIKHYRVDKMSGIAVPDEEREGQDHFKNVNVAVCSKKVLIYVSW
ncbi:MAG: WYL domain-containing protein [Oscillospiraceae bacterium]